MKRCVFILCISLCSFYSNACPICGCGVGGFYIGLLPTYNSKFFGLRYSYSHYETHLTDQPGQFSHDYYHQVELYGGLTLGKHWQILGFLPYHFNHQVTDDGIVDRNGLGDITMLANYKLWQSSSVTKKNKMYKQEFWLGAGIKLPTGKYNVNFADSANGNLDDLLGDVNSQMGTGSTDFIFNAMYNIHVGRFGLNTTANYKVNTTNNSNFKYGNRFSANSFAYYQTQLVPNIYVAPNVGLMYEHAAQNNLTNNKVNETGGYVALASGGLDINFKKITIGTNVQLPCIQDYAHGQTQTKIRGLIHITYTL